MEWGTRFVNPVLVSAILIEISSKKGVGHTHRAAYWCRSISETEQAAEEGRCLLIVHRPSDFDLLSTSTMIGMLIDR